MQCHHNILLIVLLSSFVSKVSSSIYNVVPDDHPSISDGAFTVKDYLNNTNSYFISNTQLHFLQGHHHLQSDLIIKDVINFTISGASNSSIVCNSTVPVGISILNATRFTFQNLSVINCGKDYSSQITGTLFIHYHRKIPPIHWNTAVYLHNCSFSLISNLSIITDVNINGLLAVGMMVKTKIENLYVKVNNVIKENNCSVGAVYTSGILVYYYNTSHNNFINCSMDILNFTYQYSKTHSNTSQNALSVILTQLTYSVNITVSDSSFHDLHNASIFYYYGESCGVGNKNYVLFKSCKIYNNIGKQIKQLFLIILHNNGRIFTTVPDNVKQKCDRHYNILQFNYCTFSNNSNLIQLLYLIPINTISSNAILIVRYCNFYQNYAFNLIESSSEVTMLWQLSHYMVIEATNISSNVHENGSSVISITNGYLTFAGTVTITNNSYFIGIVYLYFSILQFNGSCVISSNLARHILAGREGSYYLLKPNSTVKITKNTVVSVLTYSTVYNTQLGEVCCFQFWNYGHNIDNSVKRNKTLFYSIELIDNVYTAPVHLINRLPFTTCSWLPDTAFQIAKASDVFQRIFKLTTIQVDRSKISVMPSSICKCNSSSDYDCISHKLGTAYPGQTLTVNLIVPALIFAPKSSIEIIVADVDIPESCRIIKAAEITQMQLDHGCNAYNYTAWSEKGECELYLLEKQLAPEIFYVTLLPCPAGFAIQSDIKTCSCDSLLTSVVLSCNLNDGTVQRMANSWISAKTVNGSHTYDVSSHCPFDYCFPYSSHLHLSYSDQQCQFKRSGVLCGHCPTDLSTVFGSSDCEKCSNVTLLIILPIVVAGACLVLMLFILNLTVTNGAINTFIFYFNIISINISMFIPKCHDSLACIILSFFNLDLGIKTCFYDGMDGYAKIWLQLLFPVYLIIIALALIMGSRYSKTVQRLTARRGLAVLATLFLLSYTKFLLTVCHALFFYSTITHLPSEDSTFVWSVDTNIPLFGVRFTILFVTCLVIFLILTPFNILLLFTRPLLRFRFINTFKPLLDAYFGPYKDKFYYWTGLQLLLRAVFFSLSAFDNDVNLAGGIILLGILLCVQGVMHPFKSCLKNIQESVVLLDLLALYVTALYNEGKSKEELPVAWYLLFPVLAYFIIFVSCQCFMSVCGNAIKHNRQYIISAIKSRLQSQKESNKSVAMESLRNRIPDVTLNYKDFQEPLIAFNY